jgi:ferredoxin-thioredoxin reductase catalytic subunit
MGNIKSPEELNVFLEKNAKEKGYYLNKDTAFVSALLEGLIKNLNRYGYSSCPCRLSTGNYALDLDLICPCAYMENDVQKYGSCFCALYVSKEVYEGKKLAPSIPESRPHDKIFNINYSQVNVSKIATEKWKCSVCGYEHLSDEPPEKCPKCGASKEFFK